MFHIVNFQKVQEGHCQKNIYHKTLDYISSYTICFLNKQIPQKKQVLINFSHRSENLDKQREIFSPTMKNNFLGENINLCSYAPSSYVFHNDFETQIADFLLICFLYTSIHNTVKKRFLRTWVIFNPKNGTIGSGVDQNKYHHLFDPFLKTPLFQRKIVSSHEKLKFLM